MPNINRIRVNNIKYNFGTQGYDDFSMRMYGKNTLYDLANGGGKSILMLLLLQNLIPNCTLDEKQPIEKLFRNGGGNTTIHSLVEWKLDDKDIKEGFRYMTTGFCARKAKDNDDTDGQMSLEGVGASQAKEATKSEKNRDSASVEYFNYCIFYRDYNDNDIVNLPLQNSKERITYTGLKNYLKNLAKTNLNLKVFVFERKGEYQHFISRYGLFESQWEIVRGINKTEGHVRTYFETHYKTTRKVVEDLLIEEIIEKAFLVKTEQDDVNEDMAKTLLDIKDKLVELSKKKSEISNYDKETELMHLLEARVSSFLERFEERDKLVSTLGDVYVTGEHLSKQGEQQIAEMEEKKEAIEQRLSLERKRIDILKIVADQYVLDDAKKDLLVVDSHVAQVAEELHDAEEELNLKESINDYIRYLADQSQMEENQAMIDASLQETSGDSEKLAKLAAMKKAMDDQILKDIRNRLEIEQKKYKEAKEQLEMVQRVNSEGEIALAVAKSHLQQYEVAYQEQMEEIGRIRKDLSVLVLSDLKGMQQTMIEREQELLKQRDQLQETYLLDVKTYHEQERELYMAKEQILVHQAALDKAQERNAEYVKNQDRLKKMLQIYDVKKTEQLYETIKQRVFAQQIILANKNKEIAQVEKHLTQVEEGRILLESEAIAKVKDYLESRHGEFALSGVDYLSALPKANRQDILERFPMLPYGVVTTLFDVIREDERIGTIDLGNQAVPIFDKQTLESPYVPESQEGMLLVSKNADVFVEDDALSHEASRLQKKLTELREEYARSEELQRTYEEDLDYTAKLTADAFVNAEQEVQESRELLIESNRKLEGLQEEMMRLKSHSEEQKKLLDSTQQELLDNQKNQVKLAGVLSKSDVVDETKKQYDYYMNETQRLTKACENSDSNLTKVKMQVEDLENLIKHMETEISEVLYDWEHLYREYYDESVGEVPVTLSKEQLKGEFLAAKAVYEQRSIVLEDKQKLVETLKESMQRGLKIVKRRNVDVSVLEELRKEDKLHLVEEEFLNRMSMHLSQISVRYDQLLEEQKKKEHEATRVEGRIEQATKALSERYGGAALSTLAAYEGKEAQEGISTVTREEAKQAIVEGDRILSEVKKELSSYEQSYREYVKNHTVIVDLYKDIKRIVDAQEIPVVDAHILSRGQNEIRELFEDSLMAYDKSNKALAKAKQELYNYKTQTSNTFFAMGAYELSSSVKDDILIPENYDEAKQLLDSIREMISYISLEKERVQQGIEDMEAIKNNFENQCIERCKDVRTELEKLPKLSRIQLDGEMIQMVELTIPYVKDEFVKQRMSDYIDEVVNGADRFSENADRMKYMKSHLLLKKLFGVMVTDMNGIRLRLYKRERMKEQSRYLRYEEAVGSTGQSQGIYIQFLVSIINYISGMYAPEAEANELKKVIFIDNPFGAAKDIYIWEPIFALLRTNNVQLIVPARGATPAITNRFDVNYILGQQLMNGRQQTVVVDYRSQVPADELEYENLEYSQATFDFI